jgi:hypothetical protein
MKLLLLLTLLLFASALQQQPIDQKDSRLIVIKFKWAKERQLSQLSGSLPTSGPSMNEPLPVNQARDSHGDVRNKRDVATRRAELEANANMANSSKKRADTFRVHLEVKNETSAIIKSFVWEYQPKPTPGNYVSKQFVCATKAKPNESKKFDFVIPFAPVRVINANTKEAKSEDGEVIINRVEFTDGSVWMRQGWTGLVPPEKTKDLGNGKCHML